MADFVISAHHQLRHIEKSFGMSRHDLKARPMHHHLREPINNYLSIVFAPSRSPGSSKTAPASPSSSSSAPRTVTARSRSAPTSTCGASRTRYRPISATPSRSSDDQTLRTNLIKVTGRGLDPQKRRFPCVMLRYAVKIASKKP